MSNSIHKAFSGLLIIPVRIYQYVISPFTPASCRHVPSCSAYAVEALEVHGPATGSLLAINRIARCHPWGTEGFDPVPKMVFKKVKLKRDQMKGVQYYDRLKSKIVTMLLIPALLMISSCNQGGNERNSQTSNTVLVSILPYKFFVEQIAGDKLNTLVLIPPGTTPHVYDPTPRQMAEISKADIYFFNGHLSFEQSWLKKITDSHAHLSMVNLNKGIELIGGHNCENPGHDHGNDPHTWLSPKNGKIIAGNIYHALTEKYPEHEDVFRKNFNSLLQDIGKLDRQIRDILSETDSRKFMIFHPSLSYFARDYNLEQIPIELEGKEPSPSQLRASIDRAKNEGLKTILIQKEFDSDNATIIAREIDGNVVQVDPLSENWLTNLLDIAEKISAYHPNSVLQ